MTVKAELESGEVVVLTNDCGCTHHEGPHWLHMEHLRRRWAEQDAEAFLGDGSPGASAALAHIAAQEQMRLEMFASHLRRLGIARIIEGE